MQSDCIWDKMHTLQWDVKVLEKVLVFIWPAESGASVPCFKRKEDPGWSTEPQVLLTPSVKKDVAFVGVRLAHLKQMVNSKNTHKESAEAKIVRSCKHKREPFLDHM